MKQYEAMLEALKQNGGYAILGQLYQDTLKIPGCDWRTKYAFAKMMTNAKMPSSELDKFQPC